MEVMKEEAVIRQSWPRERLGKIGSKPSMQIIFTSGRSVCYTMCGFALLLVGWGVISGMVGESLPGPIATMKVFGQLLSHPFYDNGPNDKGVGVQLLSSIGRVFAGFALGSMVAIPIGVLMGASPAIQKVLNPLVQLLRPVSPLAWFPIGLAVFKSADHATIFVIFITSLWPTLINTAFGVASMPEEHRNVARAFAFSRSRYLRRVVIPFALPHILTGLRLSLGVAWLVIVAGEMLSGGIGIGFFVWDSWNALSLERVMSAILLIGLIGLLLDRGFDYVARKFSYV
jgi:nitrate/nitrite transport system permease protein